MKVKCPRCGGESLFSKENPFRPFCSERCKLIDLGAWAAGKYAIPAQSTHDSALHEANESDPETTDPTPDSDYDDSGASNLH